MNSPAINFNAVSQDNSTDSLFDRIWYGKHPASAFLAPIGLLYRSVVSLRKTAYSSGLLQTYDPGVPIIIVGNLTVGGTGKTPLVIWLARFLQSQGYKPGIVSRGYGGRAKTWPQQVRPDSDPNVVGDEAIVIARRTDCPIAVGPNRAENVRALMEHADVDVVISDDGLQHYRLHRSVEIAVVDGVRRFGNGRCLPAGPLREPLSRLKEVDMIVTNGIAGRGEFAMNYRMNQVNSLKGDKPALPIEAFNSKKAHAVAGIGHPEKFFSMLRSKGILCERHPFRDHKKFRTQDLVFDDDLPVLMTEKDAVKCENFALDNSWYIPIEAELPEVFGHRLNTTLEGAVSGQETA